tara:strand:+ start:50 stop:505 length:456 start_codon:yes stop_codon:yes gene_type:complete
MDIALGLIITIISFLFMEFVAWFTHKYIMHGFLWTLHKDHHQPKKENVFQKNDYFFLIFAIPGIIFIILGLSKLIFLFWIGLGITLYGLAYFIIHDIFIHQRLNLFKKTSSIYLKSLRKAHKIHHKNIEKDDGENFGMLFFPLKYWRKKSK